MHLVFLTAFQTKPFGPALDRKREAGILKSTIFSALQTAAISADVAVQFGSVDLTATITVPDADAAFAVLAPVFRASSFCRDGFVLLRYGAPGAPERQVSLAQQAHSASVTV